MYHQPKRMSSLTSLSLWCCMSVFTVSPSPSSQNGDEFLSLKMAPCFLTFKETDGALFCFNLMSTPLPLSSQNSLSQIPYLLFPREWDGEASVIHCPPSLLLLPLCVAAPLLHVVVIKLICHLNEHSLSLDALFMRTREPLECTS